MDSVPLIDLALGIPLLLWGVKGLRDGLVKEALGLFGLILAIVLAFSLMEDGHALLKELFDTDPNWLPLAAAGIIFLGVMGITQILIFSLNKTLEAAALNGLNRLLGMGFGLLKAGIVLSLILMLLAGFDKPTEQMRGNSHLYTWVLPVATRTYDFIATAWPGANSFGQTMRKTMDENNPLRRIMDKPKHVPIMPATNN